MNPADLEIQNTYMPWGPKPVVVHRHSKRVFLGKPLVGPLLFNNNDSDARDHCANERTFLSWLRMAVYLDVVGVAIGLCFHLRHPPSKAERSAAFPLGMVFWILSILCLGAGLGNYIKQMTKYAEKRAIAQTGHKTQTIFTLIAVVLVGTCIMLLIVDVNRRKSL